MPALIQFVGACPAGGFSTNATTSPSAASGTTPNADGSSTSQRWIVASRPVLVVERTMRREIESGEHVAVADDEALVDARVLGGEADAAGGAERLVLDRVAQLHVAEATAREVRDERVGEVAQRQHDLVDAVASRAKRAGARGTRWLAIGSSGFGVV